MPTYTSYDSSIPYLSRIMNDSEQTSYLTYDNYEKKQWNDPAHRTKPTDLLHNCTGLAKQYTIEKTAGSTGWCHTAPASGTRSDIFEEKQSYQSTWVPTSRSPYTDDWVTGLRLMIKEEAINLGATVAEYKQSVDMFGSATRGIVNAWNDFRKIKRNRKKLSMCSVAAAELVYTYGVAPLVSDVFDSIEALRLRLEHPVFRRYHIRKADEVKEKLDKKWPTPSSLFRGGYTGWTSHKVSQDVICYAWFDLEKASMFTLGNPLELTWEVTPFSFVVDWMIPIGDYLIALDALKAVDHLRYVRTEKIVKKHKLYPWLTTLSDAPTVAVWPVHCVKGPGRKPVTYTERSHERFAGSTLPLPTLPRPQLEGSIRRLLNATALLASVRGCKGTMPRFTKPDFPGGHFGRRGGWIDSPGFNEGP